MAGLCQEGSPVRHARSITRCGMIGRYREVSSGYARRIPDGRAQSAHNLRPKRAAKISLGRLHPQAHLRARWRPPCRVALEASREVSWLLPYCPPDSLSPVSHRWLRQTVRRRNAILGRNHFSALPPAALLGGKSAEIWSRAWMPRFVPSRCTRTRQTSGQSTEPEPSRCATRKPSFVLDGCNLRDLRLTLCGERTVCAPLNELELAAYIFVFQIPTPGLIFSKGACVLLRSAGRARGRVSRSSNSRRVIPSGLGCRTVCHSLP
jgi:hypothetical protein